MRTNYPKITIAVALRALSSLHRGVLIFYLPFYLSGRELGGGTLLFT